MHINQFKCPLFGTVLREHGFTGYGTTLYECPKCKGDFEIKVNRNPKPQAPCLLAPPKSE